MPNTSKRRYKATLIIRTVEPTPLDLSHSKEALLNYVACLVLTLPALLHYSHYFGTVPEVEDGSLQGMMEASLKDRWLSWTHLFILLNGAYAPVLHLLSDDVLCGLGLEMLNNICDSIFSTSFDIGDVTDGKSLNENVKGIENSAFEDKEESVAEDNDND